MTYLEKALRRTSGMSQRDIVNGLCPEELGLEEVSPCGVSGYAPSSDDARPPCEKCWNREMPE